MILIFIKLHKFVILYFKDKKTGKPKYYMLITFVSWFSFLGIKFNYCFLLKLRKYSLTEVTFVEDNMPSSSEEVLFESVISLSKAGKLNTECDCKCFMRNQFRINEDSSCKRLKTASVLQKTCSIFAKTWGVLIISTDKKASFLEEILTKVYYHTLTCTINKR